MPPDALLMASPPMLTPDEVKAAHQKTVLAYVASRGIQGAWFDGASMLRAPGNVPLREVTEDAGINWGGGGFGGEAYSQVNPEKFIHPQERAKQMLAECIVAAATTGKLPENTHNISISENGDLVTFSGHIAMPFNEDIEKLLPLFEAQYVEQYREAMGKAPCEEDIPRIRIKGPR